MAMEIVDLLAPNVHLKVLLDHFSTFLLILPVLLGDTMPQRSLIIYFIRSGCDKGLVHFAGHLFPLTLVCIFIFSGVLHFVSSYLSKNRYM